MSNDPLFLPTMRMFDALFSDPLDTRESLERITPATCLESAMARRQPATERPGQGATKARSGLVTEPLSSWRTPLEELQLSDGSIVQIRVSEQINGVWCAWLDDNTDGRGGWGDNREQAIKDLSVLLEGDIP